MSCDKACEADGFCTPVSLNRTKAEDDSELGMVCPEYLNANKIDLTPLLLRTSFIFCGRSSHVPKQGMSKNTAINKIPVRIAINLILILLICDFEF